MNKKGVEWQYIVMAILALVGLFVLIMIISKSGTYIKEVFSSIFG